MSTTFVTSASCGFWPHENCFFSDPGRTETTVLYWTQFGASLSRDEKYCPSSGHGFAHQRCLQVMSYSPSFWERKEPPVSLLTTRGTMLFPAETFLLTTGFPLKRADFPVGQASPGLCSATCLLAAATLWDRPSSLHELQWDQGWCNTPWKSVSPC